MSSPLFNAMGGGMPQNRSMQLMNSFKQFMQQNKGKNPTQELNNLLMSGRINQAQLNQAQQMANQMKGMFQGFFN